MANTLSFGGELVTGTLPRGTSLAVRRRLTPEPERPLPQDPVAWVRDELDEHLWSHQSRLMRSVISNRYTAWKACHGPGKSFSAARLIAWWISGHPLGEAIAVSTAPSGPQVRAILWRELSRAHRKAGLGGKITTGAIPEWLWTAVDTLVTNEASRVLAIGNPDDPTTHFAKVCAPGSGWNVLKTSAFDTPAFTGEQIPEQMRESLVSKLWVQERERE